MSSDSDIRSLPTITGALLLIVMVAGVSVIMLNEFQDQQVFNITVVNESIDNTSIILGAPFFLAAINHTYFIDVDNGSVRCYNGSFEFLQVGNYTTYANGSVTPIFTGMIDANSNLSVNYTYRHGSEARDIYGSGIDGAMEITEWLELIALIFAAGIILYLVLKAVSLRDMGKQGY